MALRVSGKNLQIGEALQEHARSRVAAVTDRYVDRAIDGHVTLEPEGSGFRCEMLIHLGSGTTLHAEGRAHDPYGSFDQANHRIETRLRRHKRRVRGRAPAVGLLEPVAETISDYLIEAPRDQEAGDDEQWDDEAGAGFSPVIVAETKAPFKTLSVAAAVEELDLSGLPVMVFRHSGNRHVNFVYRRADGHIGWIDPSSIAEQP